MMHGQKNTKYTELPERAANMEQEKLKIKCAKV